MKDQVMKAYVKAAGATIRSLRQGEVKVRDHMRSQRSFEQLVNAEVERVTGSPRNYTPDLTVFEAQRSRLYSDRMEMKQIARSMNLAYAMAGGKNYQDVEQTIREYNEPDAETVFNFLFDFGYEYTIQDVVEWLDQEEVE